MSLRHSFPVIDLPELRKDAEPLVAVPAMRKPSEVKFRSGRDLKEIAQMMNGKNVVKVVAAVGAGKSTLLPRELVLSTGAPLLHVVPSKLLAVAQFDYLSKKYTDMEYVLSLDGTEQYSKTGITIATSASVCARLLSSASLDNALGGVIVFMDESHESDAYTYTLYKLAHAIPGVKGVVFASANHDPVNLPMRETEGEVQSMRFSSKDTPKMWNPHDLNKPWSMSSFNGSVLMFVEPNSVANRLVSAYSEAGATAYRLTAKMEVSLFRRAYADCMNPGSGIVVLIADYSFRSGFTFDISSIIDCGVVSYDEVDGTTQKLKYRQAYEIERYQAQGRGGRTAGSSCLCYFPDFELEASLCNLEALEVDAAAILFRCLGYAVPSELRSSKFVRGVIPKDLVFSLNDTTALVVQSDNMMHELVYISESRAQQIHDDDLIDVVRSYADSPVETSDLYSGLRFTGSSEVKTRMKDAHELLHDLASVDSSTSSVAPPMYYMVPGLKNDIVTTRLYGEDVAKCVDELGRHSEMIRGFSSRDVREIIAMLLNAYNMLNATVIGMSFAANHGDELLKASAAYPSLTRNWAEQLQGKIRIGSAKLNVYASVLNDLKPSSMHYIMVDSFKEMEDKIASKVAGQLINAIRATSRKLDAEAYQASMLPRVDMPGFASVRQETLKIQSGDVQTASVTLLPRRHSNGRSTWRIVVEPNDTERWEVNDYVDACMEVIKQANVATKSVTSIRLPDHVSQSNASKVVSMVRDVPHHRVERQFKIC